METAVDSIGEIVTCSTGFCNRKKFVTARFNRTSRLNLAEQPATEAAATVILVESATSLTGSVGSFYSFLR